MKTEKLTSPADARAMAMSSTLNKKFDEEFSKEVANQRDLDNDTQLCWDANLRAEAGRDVSRVRWYLATRAKRKYW